MSARMSAPSCRCVSIALVTFLLAWFPRVSAVPLGPAREYEIKAGFLFNFCKFVDWPEDAFKSGTDELRLEVIGHDPFDGALDRLVAGKFIDQHPLRIVYSSAGTTGLVGQMVFVSASQQKQWPRLLALLSRTPTLTVSDIDQFAEHGGVIGLVANGPSLGFVINRAAATRARLRVSSKLMALGTILDRDLVGSFP
jgi:YfiR/HmsC-like